MLCNFDGWYVNSFVFKIFAMRSHTMIQNYFMIILKCLVIFVFFFSQHVRISNRMDAHCFFLFNLSDMICVEFTNPFKI